MIESIKQQVSLIAEIEADLGVNFKQQGEKNWVIEDEEVESCPFCGHHKCFSIHHVEGLNTSSFYKCFSCGEKGDVIAWKEKHLKLTTSEAIKHLAEKHGIKYTGGRQSPVQQVFNLAVTYYQACLLETMDRPFSILNGLTPYKYQTEFRKHKPESIDKFKIGFSDGGLVDYLFGVGIDKEIIIESGLGVADKKGVVRDFLPRMCFIYPHFVKGQPSHFTIKDPIKQVNYQLKSKYSLNGYLFYGQDTFGKDATVVLVEGENDRISVMETGMIITCLATIGTLSADQMTWLRENCKDKRVVTLFDPDDGGDTYREKIESLRSNFKGGLIQILPPDGKDIDELLCSGANFKEIIQNNVVKVQRKPKANQSGLSIMFEDIEATKTVVTPLEDLQATLGSPTVETPLPWASDVVPNGEAIEVADQVVQTRKFAPPVALQSNGGDVESEPEFHQVSMNYCNVEERFGCYVKQQYDKEGMPFYVYLSNFTLRLLNVFQREDGDREREVVLVRQDGYKSKPFMVSSETKVSVKLFKTLIAKVADGAWTGKEGDLDSMWALVYEKGHDALIEVPRRIGYHDVHKCWIFKNLLITASGSVIHPDDKGVFWISGKNHGIKPEAVTSDTSDPYPLPEMETGLSREQADELLGTALHHFAGNIGGMGAALLAFGWIYSNVYSDAIFRMNRGMSVLMLWSMYGEGKTTLVSWLRCFFGFLDNTGRTTITMLKSGVGFQRMGEYYSSIPLFLDEVRSDEESDKHLGMVRSWYDRDGRVMGAKDSNSVRSQKVRSNLIIAGEDLPSDPATRERCVGIRVPPAKTREMVKSYEWFEKEDTRHNLSNITFYWIQDACLENPKVLTDGIKAIDTRLRAAGCSSRTSKNWAAAGYLGEQLRQKFCPEFDFLDWLEKTSLEEYQKQKADGTVAEFFNAVEIIMRIPGNDTIGDAQIKRDSKKNVLYIWFSSVFAAVAKHDPRNKKWSRNMVLRAIQEEPYYVGEKKTSIGPEGTRNMVIVLDLSKAPDTILNIAQANKDTPTEQPVVSSDF